MDDFVPSDMIKRAIRLWWLVALLMVAGGIAGVLISRMQKPVYESRASITTSIDFAYTNRLSSDEEDYLISSVGDVIDSSRVLELVKENARNQGITLTDEQIRTAFRKDRQGYRWLLTVRDSSPETAQRLAQIWVEAADQGLAIAHQNTLDALMLQSAQLALEDCFSQSVVVDPASSYCLPEHLAEIRVGLSNVSVQGNEESLPNAILLSKITTQISDNAFLPVSPVLYRQNLSAFAGIICGLLVSLVVLFYGKPSRS